MTSSAPTKRPLAADPLTAIAPLLRVRPEIQEICRFAARWEAEHQAEPLGWAQFHVVTNGRCFLEQRYGEPLLLQAGNLLLLPHGDAHVVRSAAGDRPLPQTSELKRVRDWPRVSIGTALHGR